MKKNEPNKIVSLNVKKDKLIVQKSLPLFALWKSNLTLSEFKILDIYLSRIDSHHPENNEIVIGKGEIEQAIGVKKINNKDLNIRLRHLMGNVVEITDKDEEKGFKLITLFEDATAEIDEEGLWKVKLKCTNSAMKYIFNIENLGYFRYKLRCITSLKSRYTYIMFIYLESNRKYRKSWDISLEELKVILNCEHEETYKEYKRFNDLVLKKIQKELHEKTECRFNYEPIRKGRSVSKIKFTLEKIKEEIEGSEINPIPADFKNVSDEELSRDELEVWERSLIPLKLAKEQREEIFSLIVTVPEEKLPPRDPEFPLDLELQLFHYLDIKVSEILRRDSNDPIKNKYAYLLKMIKQDIYE